MSKMMLSLSMAMIVSVIGLCVADEKMTAKKSYYWMPLHFYSWPFASSVRV